MNRKILYLFITFSILLSSCRKEKQLQKDLFEAIPPKTFAVLKTSDLSLFINQLNNQEWLKQQEYDGFLTYFTQSFLNNNYLKLEEESLICFTPAGKDRPAITLLSKHTPELVDLDKIKDKKVTSYTYDNATVKHYTLNKVEAYTVQLEQLFVVSTSKLVLENIIRNFATPIPQPAGLEKIYETGASAKFALFFNFPEVIAHFDQHFTRSFNNLKGLTGWSILEISLEPEKIQLDGITQAVSAQSAIIDAFASVKPQHSELAAVVPLNAYAYTSFTFDQGKKLIEALGNEKKNSKTKDSLSLAETLVEIGSIHLPQGDVVAARALDISLSKEALLAHTQVSKNFRSIDIFKFDNADLFRKQFYPLITAKKLSYYCFLDNHLIFAEKIASIEHIIANYLNESTLINQNYYKETLSSLSDYSSILSVSLNDNFKNLLKDRLKSNLTKDIEQIKTNGFPITATQLVYDTNFAHVHMVMQKINRPSGNQNAIQVGTIKTEKPINKAPFFFPYWRTGEQYIAVQDIDHLLQVFNYKGELVFSKALEGPILGEPQVVDLYNNSRLQIAFSTPHQLHILAVNGKSVKPFPLQFKSPQTQALGVFDYANNHNYRFVSTQNNVVLMWDKNGKQVKGFQMKPTSSPILNTPNHLRIESRDYISIPEESGSLHLLSRTGEERLKIKEKIDFSSAQWQVEKNKFSSLDTKGKILIDEKAKLTRKDLGLQDNHTAAFKNGTWAISNENELLINDKRIQLDYGLYTQPAIFEFNKQSYITITDTQAQKVYVFDKNGELLPGFPVYGNSRASIENIDAKGKLELIVQGEKNSVLIYHLN
ncbi:hypothetical protein ACFSQ0_01135 [Mesonia sediminis]|uniref:Uncharacterized protein n=1 Tax=Mesonia sediminis TaxID=1703946 RepID=A0ABW5S9Z3_9FLAO